MFTTIHFFNDPAIVKKLRPLTDHRSLCQLLIGTSTIEEKWSKFTQPNPETPNILYLLGCVLPTESLLKTLSNLKPTETLYHKNTLVAYYKEDPNNTKISLDEIQWVEHPEDLLTHQLHLLLKEIKPNHFSLTDYQSRGNTIISPDNCYIHPRAKLVGCTLDASTGPIHIGEHANIQIGTIIQGPAAILEHATTNLGAKIRPNTTIGAHCKVGGEISYSIIHPFSNKAHDGYLGNSIIGSFCNFGAQSNSSNVRNDLGEVSIYCYEKEAQRPTGKNSIGLITGDYVTTGIGSQFNTGTVIGSHANISCPPFPPRFIPPFTWGVSPNFERFRLEKAKSMAKIWTESKQQVFEEKTAIRMDEIWKAM